MKIEFGENSRMPYQGKVIEAFEIKKNQEGEYIQILNEKREINKEIIKLIEDYRDCLHQMLEYTDEIDWNLLEGFSTHTFKDLFERTGNILLEHYRGIENDTK